MKKNDFIFNYIPIAICFFVIFCSKNAKSQDLFFSQYFNVPMYANPAFAAHERNSSFVVSNRRQWSGLGTPYTTNQASGVVPLYHKKYSQKHFGGVGLSVTQDKSGQGLFLQTFMAQATGAYNLYFSQDGYQRLSFGILAGIIERRTDPDAMQWGSQYSSGQPSGFDASLGSGENLASPTRLMADIGSGLLWYYNPQKNYLLKSYSWYAGIAASHINMPNQSPLDGLSQPLPILWKGSGGLEWSFYKNLVFSPNMLVLYQNGIAQYNIGSHLGYTLWNQYGSEVKTFDNTQLQIGAWYRAQDAFILMAGLKSNYFSLGFSYDLTVSSLSEYKSGGSYEFSLGFYLPHKPKPKRFSSPLY